jgi:hypothetical protein
MRRYGLGGIVCGAILFPGGFAVGQTSLDVLEQELKDAKEQHVEVTTQALSAFFSQIDAAMSDPDAAETLYQNAGGSLPDPTAVVTEHTSETATEKEARLALDQTNLTILGRVLELHCGLMHYAALFAVKPDQKGLQEDWAGWLKRAAPVYAQLAMPPDQKPAPHKKKADKDDNEPAPVQKPVPIYPMELRGKTMRESIIGKYLGFHSWGDGEQGGWSLKDLPKLYRANVLDPSRTSPSTATLAAWDAYIAMENVDEKDDDKWNQVDYPPLQFERASDDYAISPSTEKLEVLVNIIKANPANANVDDWISRVHQMMEGYRAKKSGVAISPAATSSPSAVPPSSSPDPANPGVTVTTTTQGDMTIVTTHTNAAPVTPPTP